MSVAQDLFLGIINSVETGLKTPEEAVTELADLKEEYGFKSDWTLADFQTLRNNFLSELPEGDFYDDDDLEFEDDADE
jgi:hypothetical protein